MTGTEKEEIPGVFSVVEEKAGADIIITYHAKEVAGGLASN